MFLCLYLSVLLRLCFSLPSCSLSLLASLCLYASLPLFLCAANFGKNKRSDKAEVSSLKEERKGKTLATKVFRLSPKENQMKLLFIEEQKSTGFRIFSSAALAFYEEGKLTKARSHKYIKREPYTTASGKKKYRYWYKMPNGQIVSSNQAKQGASVHTANAGEETHYIIRQVNGDQVTVENIQTKEVKTLSIASLSSALQGHLSLSPGGNASSVSSLLHGIESSLLQGFSQKNIHEEVQHLFASNPSLLSKLQQEWQNEANHADLLEEVLAHVHGELFSSFEADAEARLASLSPEQQGEAVDKMAEILQPIEDYFRSEASSAVEAALSSSRSLQSVLSAPPQENAEELEQLNRYRQRNTLKDFQNHPFLANPPTSKEELLALFQNEADSLEDVFRIKGDFHMDYSFQEMDDGEFLMEINFRDKNTKKRACSIERKFFVRDNGFELDNTYLEVVPEFRDHNIAMQIYQRQEDFFRQALSSMPDDFKKNSKISLEAALDVGRYYWMTQGFLYKNSQERKDTIESIKDVLISIKDWLATPDPNAEPPRFNPYSRFQKKDFAQVAPEDFDKALKQIDESYLKKGDSLQPWDLLHIGEHSPIFKVNRYSFETKGMKEISCDLIKMAALEGREWHGEKPFFPQTALEQEGADFAERRRALDAKKAEDKGKPWTWLNLAKSLHLSKSIKNKQGLALLPSKTNPKQKRWQRVAEDEGAVGIFKPLPTFVPF